MPTPLPIDSYVPAIVDRVRAHRAVVLTAAPGAGKTTRVPPALAADGPVIVLQPRRVAARSIARRIADEQAWTLGREVGWHVRFERQFGPKTSVLLATEGILTARLQQDALLSGFRTIVLDEFHERTIHADLGIALARQAWLARRDLRLVVMSATIDPQRVSEYLDGCPILDVPGTLHPLDIRYMPRAPLPEAVMTATRASRGNVLCFLAGAREIADAAEALQAPAADAGIQVVPLHGSLSAADQDAAISSVPGRRIILATNIAETSLTVPGVRAVVDTGEHKVARYDAGRAIDTLETERIPADSADQRAGRAGRFGAGLVIRLWDRLDRLIPHRQPEIMRIDLSGPTLDILAWGGDPRSFEWLDAPTPDAVEDAFRLLEALGATERGGLTDIGRRMPQLPVHPRLARILIAAGGSREAALACALLSERSVPFATGRVAATTTSDLLSAVERPVPPRVERAARTLESIVAGAERRQSTPDEFRRAVLCGYPDRVGRRRAPGSGRFLLSSGTGAVLGADSGVRDAEYIVAVDVVGGHRGDASEGRVRTASAVDRDWLQPTDTRTEHWLDTEHGTVRAAARDYYGAILLGERPGRADPAEASKLLTDAYLAAHVSGDDRQLLRRLEFAGMPHDRRELVERAVPTAESLKEIDLMHALDWHARRDLERLAPEWVDLPSGRRARLEYKEDGSVLASVKLQELFGLADTPRVGAKQEPVLLALLAPNGRPVQLTRDLRSFWERTYPDVRKELRGRYPRHPWPEDPWTAVPTARTKKRGV